MSPNWSRRCGRAVKMRSPRLTRVTVTLWSESSAMAGDDDAGLLQPRHRADRDAVEIGILHLQGDALERITSDPLLTLEGGRLGRDIDFEIEPQESEREHDPDDRGRHAAEPPAGESGEGTAGDEGEGVAIENPTLASQRGEEARPDLHTEGKDKKNQPEVLQKMRDLDPGAESEVSLKSPAKRTPATPSLVPAIRIFPSPIPGSTTKLMRRSCATGEDSCNRWRRVMPALRHKGCHERRAFPCRFCLYRSLC